MFAESISSFLGRPDADFIELMHKKCIGGRRAGILRRYQGLPCPTSMTLSAADVQAIRAGVGVEVKRGTVSVCAATQQASAHIDLSLLPT